MLTCLFIVTADRIIDTSECGVTFVAYYLLMGCYLCKRNDIETAVFIINAILSNEDGGSFCLLYIILKLPVYMFLVNFLEAFYW